MAHPHRRRLVSALPPATSDALACLDAGLRAVEAGALVVRALGTDPTVLAGDDALTVLAAGKAAAHMAEGLARVAGERVARGTIVVPHGTELLAPAGVDVVPAGHPLPDAGSVRAGERVLAAAQGAVAGDRVVVLLSGGASALLTLPPEEVTLADLAQVTADLLRAGADIGETNCVRKHLDRLKGGGLARALEPARTLALVLSDVPGDRLDWVASGPLAPDPSTFDEAIEVLRRHGCWTKAPAGVREHLHAGARGDLPETPKESEACFDLVETLLIGSNRTALDAVVAAAAERGYPLLEPPLELAGEARMMGARMVELARRLQEERRRCCLVAGGETTVTVHGDGVGARNLELALAAALTLRGARGITLATLATDGIDGSSDAAGAWVDGGTVARAREHGLDPDAALENNDSGTFFDALGQAIRPGPTGTNVMDLALVLIDPL